MLGRSRRAGIRGFGGEMEAVERARMGRGVVVLVGRARRREDQR